MAEKNGNSSNEAGRDKQLVERRNNIVPLSDVAQEPLRDGNEIASLECYRASFPKIRIAGKEVLARRYEAEGETGNVPKIVLSTESGEAQLSADEGHNCDLLIALGEANSSFGDQIEAEKSLVEAAKLAEHLGDTRRLARVVRAMPCWQWPAPGQPNLLALLFAQRGLSLERENSGIRALLMARVAAETVHLRGQRECSRETARAAMDLAREGDPQTELPVRLFRDPVLREPQSLSERLDNAGEIIRLAVESGDRDSYFLGGLAKAACFTISGDIGRAHDAFEASVGSMFPTAPVLHRGISAASRGSRMALEGKFAEADVEFMRCCELGAKSTLPHLIDASWPAMLMPFGESARLDEIETFAEDTIRRRPGALAHAALLSWLKMRLNKPHDALFLLHRLAADDFAELAQLNSGWVGMAALAEVCSRLDRGDYAATLYDQLVPYARLNAAMGAIAIFGSLERYLGELALTLGRLEQAIGHFERALEHNRRIGARPYAVYSQWGLARTRLIRGGPDDGAWAERALRELALESEALRMKALSAQVEDTRTLNCGYNSDPKQVEERRLETALVQVRTTNETEPSIVRTAASFCRKGECWEFAWEGKSFSLKHRKGFGLIASLLAHPGREFCALELTNVEAMPPQKAPPDRPQKSHDDCGAILDAAAKQSYRQRLGELRKELEEARAANDCERADRIEQEYDFLTREVARAIGLVGDRKFTSQLERARVSVQMAISRAIAALSDHDTGLARHLKRTIKTGNFCSYILEPTDHPRWKL